MSWLSYGGCCSVPLRARSMLASLCAQDDYDSEGASFYVQRLGPFERYTVSGYSLQDASIFPKPGLFLSTESAE